MQNSTNAKSEIRDEVKNTSQSEKQALPQIVFKLYDNILPNKRFKERVEQL